MDEFRVRFYDSADLSLSMFAPRIEKRLEDVGYREDLTLEDAIELHEIWLCMDSGFRMLSWDNERYERLRSAARQAKSIAIRVTRKMLTESPLNKVVVNLTHYYVGPFWRLLEAAGLLKELQDEEIESLVEFSAHHLGHMLTYRDFVNAHSEVLAHCLVSNPLIGVPLLLRMSSLSNNERRKLYYPKGITQAALDKMVLEFISDGDANINYFEVLANRRAFAALGLEPSPRVLAAAERAHKDAVSKLFSAQCETGALGFGVEVRFDGDQLPCRKLSYNGRVATYSYGRAWLERFVDCPTVLNNLAFIFTFVDSKGNILAAQPKHSEDSIVSHVGIHMNGEYPSLLAFNITDSRQILVLAMYEALLEAHHMRIEDALEWFFNEYVLGEFGIGGFRIDLPGAACTPLEKCGLIGPQIERVLKTITMLGRDGSIDKAQYKFEQFGGFGSVPTLLGSKKYAYCNGSEYENISRLLFSRQSMLAYVEGCDVDARNFFELMCAATLTLEMFREEQQEVLKEIIDKGLLALDASGRIVPTEGTRLFVQLWTNGSISLHRLTRNDREVVEAMLDEGILVDEESFLSRQEADYMSFVFDNRKFVNALALRNKYEHAPDIDDDPYATKHVQNYYRLLALVIDIALKLNDELCLKTDSDDGVDYVDWSHDSTTPDDLAPLFKP